MASLYGSLKFSSGWISSSNCVARAAGAAAQRVAALDHEVLDDAVEDGAVVERRARLVLAGLRVGPGLLAGGQSDEVLDGLRRVVAEEVDLDVAVVGVDRGYVCVQRHGSILSHGDERIRQCSGDAGLLPYPAWQYCRVLRTHQFWEVSHESGTKA